ncbi:hypothetical protein PNEG_03421 [Pneumocystis murina B123]|uniref:Uncharacterized protein n=1 Tax=Pneumocystis murina (strain B123) TaxID=1069680 RepID=M7PCT5_PNEMU|nr:hypothetical protein PNEG_03421 [Pneumocystis murina B123]EMR08254.1 hypothetical protein PNEG_03421 [Pneumocystis murina B123]
MLSQSFFHLSEHKQLVLSLFKRLLFYAKRLPVDSQEICIHLIKDYFSTMKTSTNLKKNIDGLKYAYKAEQILKEAVVLKNSVLLKKLQMYLSEYKSEQVKKKLSLIKLSKRKDYSRLCMILTKRIRSFQNLQDRLTKLQDILFHAKHEQQFYKRLGISEQGWTSELETHIGVINIQLSLQTIKKMVLKAQLKR